MEKVLLNADIREGTGKAFAKKMRREGFIPGVIYGPKREKSIPLRLSYSELNKLVGEGEKENVLIDLNIKQVKGDEDLKVTAVFKGIQRDPVSGRIVHIDLYEVIKDQKIHVHIPIHLLGKPAGVEAGGIIQYGLRELEVECLPQDLPESIDIEVSSLNIGDSLHVRDIKVDDKIRILNDHEVTVVSILPPVKEGVVVKSAEEIEKEIAQSFEEKEKERTT